MGQARETKEQLTQSSHGEKKEKVDQRTIQQVELARPAQWMGVLRGEGKDKETKICANFV